MEKYSKVDIPSKRNSPLTHFPPHCCRMSNLKGRLDGLFDGIIADAMKLKMILLMMAGNIVASVTR